MNAKKNYRSGMSIIQVLMASVIVAGLALLVAKLGQSTARSSRHAREISALMSLRNRMVSASKDPIAWGKKLRKASEKIKKCIPIKSSGDIPSCPGNNSSIKKNDKQLSDWASSKSIASVELVDLGGDPLAGTLDDPLYLDSDGAICKFSDPQKRCPLKSTGYLIREGSVDNPGAIAFVLKVERNLSSGTSGKLALKPIYERINMGSSWYDEDDSDGESDPNEDENSDESSFSLMRNDLIQMKSKAAAKESGGDRNIVVGARTVKAKGIQRVITVQAGLNVRGRNRNAKIIVKTTNLDTGKVSEATVLKANGTADEQTLSQVGSGMAIIPTTPGQKYEHKVLFKADGSKDGDTQLTSDGSVQILLQDFGRNK
ncbi:hypothetical protein GW916_01640 [bacterium]|nr:hypothetical protein [bacterium]